jgi:hypothetical protein
LARSRRTIQSGRTTETSAGATSTRWSAGRPAVVTDKLARAERFVYIGTPGLGPVAEGRSCELVGVVPAEFEPADEAVFDFRCDVTVGLDEPIAEMVISPS